MNDAFKELEVAGWREPDFVGINVYKPGWYVEPSNEAPGYHDIPVNASHPKMPSRGTSSTRRSCTGRLVRCLRLGSRDVPASVPWSTSACDLEGVPVNGYVLWSAQDNFEWMDGYGNRLGLIYVDFETLERTPKLSAEWFRAAARQNALV